MMEYGQHELTFDFTLHSKPLHLLPNADPPKKDNIPRDLFTLETVTIQEGINNHTSFKTNRF